MAKVLTARNVKKSKHFLFDTQIAFNSARSYDVNGYLHVTDCVFTQAEVSAYLGEDLSSTLEPKKVYTVKRPAEVLKKALKTFKNLPIVLDHHDMDAQNFKVKVKGSTGEKVYFDVETGQVKGNLVIYDGQLIEAIRNNKINGLSLGTKFKFAYNPDILESDFVLTELKGNHLAVVENPRVKEARINDWDTIKATENQKNKKIDQGTVMPKYNNSNESKQTREAWAKMLEVFKNAGLNFNAEKSKFFDFALATKGTLPSVQAAEAFIQNRLHEDDDLEDQDDDLEDQDDDLEDREDDLEDQEDDLEDQEDDLEDQEDDLEDEDEDDDLEDEDDDLEDEDDDLEDEDEDLEDEDEDEDLEDEDDDLEDEDEDDDDLEDEDEDDDLEDEDEDEDEDDDLEDEDDGDSVTATQQRPSDKERREEEEKRRLFKMEREKKRKNQLIVEMITKLPTEAQEHYKKYVDPMLYSEQGLQTMVERYLAESKRDRDYDLLVPSLVDRSKRKKSSSKPKSSSKSVSSSKSTSSDKRKSSDKMQDSNSLLKRFFLLFDSKKESSLDKEINKYAGKLPPKLREWFIEDCKELKLKKSEIGKRYQYFLEKIRKLQERGEMDKDYNLKDSNTVLGLVSLLLDAEGKHKKIKLTGNVKKDLQTMYKQWPGFLKSHPQLKDVIKPLLRQLPANVRAKFLQDVLEEYGVDPNAVMHEFNKLKNKGSMKDSNTVRRERNYAVKLAKSILGKNIKVKTLRDADSIYDMVLKTRGVAVKGLKSVEAKKGAVLALKNADRTAYGIQTMLADSDSTGFSTLDSILEKF